MSRFRAYYKKKEMIFVFYDVFIKLCEQKRMSPAAVTRELGLNNSSSTAWKRGATPKSNTLQKIADYFGVSLSCLLDQEEPDREYEKLLDVLRMADIEITAAGFSHGGADRDVFYLKQEDTTEEERREIEYKELVQIVHKVLQDAESKKLSYIRQRLNIELF